MRTIAPAALAQILEREGTDPITLVQIFWDEQVYDIFGSRSFDPGIKGGLLDIGEIDNVVNAGAGSNTGSVSIRLNDTDGRLKTILDSMDIHKRPVYVLQWFPQIPLRDAFVVFDGVISTPIVWKEGDRTLSFDVITKIESLEVAYSAEEGNFEYIPPNMVGKTWPLIFGTVLHLPALRVNDIPEGFTNQDTGIDGTGEGQGPLANVANTEFKNITFLTEMERQCFIFAAVLLGEADFLNGEASFSRQSDNPQAQQLYDLGTQYEAKGNEYRQERLRPINADVFNNPANTALQRNQLTISGGSRFPQKQNIIITINGAKHEGYFEGDIFTIVSRTHPYTDKSSVVGPTEVIDRSVATEFKTDLGVETFFYAVAGSGVGISISHYPVYYIVGIPWVTNVLVLAKKKKGGITKFTVPAAYYSVQYTQFGDLKVTIVAMSRPLSSRGEDWEDEIWVNCKSPIGPNAVDIMQYIIEHYTDESIDTTSFTSVRADITHYQMNFAYLTRKNALQCLQEIAYQSRCALWFKGGRFYLKYLPKVASPTETFVEADIESGTMEVFSTETEDVATKWSVTWRPRLDLEPPDKIVYRYHIKKYGLIEQTYDCYGFNNKAAVQKFAQFWMIRKANTWKKIRFSTFMTKLRVEPFDSVLINFAFPWVNDPGCVNQTIGVVESASYDSATQRIQMVIWLPIRLGEMCPYDFAYPSDLDTTFIFPQENDPGVDTGVPGSGANGQLYDQSTQKGPGGTIDTTPQNSGSGGDTTPGDGNDGTAGKYDPPVELNPNDLHYGSGPPTAVRSISQRVIKPLDIHAIDVPDATFPGFVRTIKSGNEYNVECYPNGLNATSKMFVVRQLLIDNTDIIPDGTPAIVMRNTQRNNLGLIQSISYTMQVPVWIAPRPTDDTGDPAGEINKPPDEGGTPPEPERPPPEADEGDQGAFEAT